MRLYQRTRMVQSPSLHNHPQRLGFWAMAILMLVIYPNVLWMRIAVAVGFVLVSFTLWPEIQTCVATSQNVSITATTAPWLFPERAISKHVYTCQPLGVRVRGEILRYCGVGHQVVIEMEDGKDVFVTSYCTLHAKSCHHQVAQALSQRLELDYKPEPTVEQATRPETWQAWLEHMLETKFRDKKD
eukprot:m.3295 g.3295  ORF g.3295 m.3295 type:complete len:186 (-) comp4933_c0_seq2:815-1372(-)